MKNWGKMGSIFWALGFFAGSVLIIRITAAFTSFPDKIFPSIQSFFSKILFGFSTRFSFSVGDVFYTILALMAFVFITRLLIIICKKKRDLLIRNISGLIWALAIFYWVFHILWGFNYYKKPIKEDYNIEKITLDELKYLAEFYYNRSVELRKAVNEDERGVFQMELNKNQIRHEIFNSAQIVKSKFPEVRFLDSTAPNLKESLFSTPFSYMGVAGYYIPFTAESQYNSNMPDTKRLFTQLHETAHQWGFAPENEANFVGFLLGVESSHRDLQYASNYRAMRSILNRILLEDPIYVQIMLIRYSDGMKRDRAYERLINEKYEGKTEDAFSLMNEAFLRINNQEKLNIWSLC